MKITVSPSEQKLTGAGTVSFEIAPYSTDRVALLLNKTMRNFKVEILSPSEIRGKAELKAEEQPNGQTGYVLTFRQPQPAGRSVTLKFSYSGGDSLGQQYFMDTTYCFAGGVATAWYPQIIEVRGTSDSSLMDGVGKIKVTAPKAYVPVMASALSDKGSGNECTFTVKEPSVFTLFVGKYHAVRLDGSIPVSAYLLTEHKALEEYLDGCKEVLECLANEFGAYPYPDFSLIEFPDYVADRLSIGGASMVGGIMMPTTALNADFNLALYGHELAHQWWGNLIRNSGERGNGMLDEAMAQYGSLLVVEELDGPEGAERYRRTGYPGYISSQCGLGYLKVAASGTDEMLSHLSARSIHVIDDSKGFLVYNLLRHTLGADSMRVIFRTIVTDHAHGYLTWDQFLAELQKNSHRDLQWFFSQWFDRTGAPEWKLEWRQEGDVIHGTITQTSQFYRLAIDIEAKGRTGQTSVSRIEVNEPVQSFTMPVGFHATSVVADPHFIIPHWEPEYKEQAFALVTPTRMTEYRISRQFDSAKALYDRAVTEIPDPDKYGVRFSLEYDMGRVYMMQDNPKEALPHFLEAVRAPSRRDDLLAWAYLRVAQMALLLKDTALVNWGAKAAISADALQGGSSGATEQARALLQN